MQRDTEFQKRFKILVRVIARETDTNDHTGAIITLARSIPDAAKEAAALVGLRAEQIEMGHLTPKIGFKRDQLAKRVDRLAKSFFTPEEMKQINAAF